MKIHNIDATGSFTYNGVDLSNLTGSTSDSGSFSTQILNLNQVSSSFNSFTSSINTTIKSKLDSESVISGSIQVSITGTTGYSTFSSSVSSSIGSLSGSVATTTSGLSSSIGSLSSSVATTTSDLSSSVGSLSSSVATNTSGLAGRITTIEGRYATTGSNAFIGTQTITGSLYISSDLVVQGSSSLQDITASAVNIGANIVNLNTANPAIRFAGLNIFDSGSIGGSGSFLYDAVQDEFIFVHRGDNANVTSSVVMMGPQTYNNIGSETYPTANRILKGTGNEHVGDSIVSEIEGGIGISGSLSITGSIIATGTALVSSSVQITYSGLTGIPSGIISGSAQLNTFGFATTGSNTFTGIQSIGTSASPTSGGNLLRVFGSGSATNMQAFTTTNHATFFEANTNSGSIVTRLQSQTAPFVGTLTNNTFDVVAGGNVIIRTTGSGLVGINKSTTPNATLDVNGNALVSGSIITTGAATFNSSVTAAGSTYIGGTQCTAMSNIYGASNYIYYNQSTASTIQGANTNTVTNGSIVITNIGGTGAYSIIGNAGPASGYGLFIQSQDRTAASYYPLLLQPNGGNVGIGTVAPKSTLDVATTSVSDNVASTLTLSAITNAAYGQCAMIQAFVNDTGNAECANIGSIQFIKQRPAGNSIGGDMIFSTRNFATSGMSSPTEKMRITSCGKVGILATDPKWLLEICCNTTATGGGGYPAMAINNPNDAGYSAYYFFKGSTNMGGLELSNATCHLFVNTNCTFAISTNNIERLRVNQNGYISIGANTPIAPLAVYVCANTTSVPTVQFVSRCGDGSAVFTTIGGSDSWHGIALRGVPNCSSDWSITAGNQISFFEYGGDFRFYQKQPSSLAMQVQLYNGTIYALSTSIVSLSDCRLKENIRTIGYGLNEIIQLKPKMFDWKEGQGTGIKDNLGFMAQDVETLLPELVKEWCHTEGVESYKTLKMGDMIPVLVKGMQEQQCIICSQASMINTLKTCLGIM